MTEIPMPSDDLIIKAADDAGLCFPTCWGLANAEEEADDAAFAATSPEAAEIVAKHEQLKRDRLEQLRNFWNTAASYGADQELEACCEWFVRDWADVETADKLRAARRPEPPGLREEALAKTTALLDDPGRVLLIEVREILELNRRALRGASDD